MERRSVTEDGRRREGGMWDVCTSHLFQAFHVFEVETNVEKAEIRIYKLKLRRRGKKANASVRLSRARIVKL